MKLKKGTKIICKKFYQDNLNRRVKFVPGKQYEISHITASSNNMIIYSIRCEPHGGDVFYSEEYFEGFPTTVNSPVFGKMTINKFPGKSLIDYFDVDIKTMRRLKLKKINSVCTK